jgi:hypothetical protein
MIRVPAAVNLASPSRIREPEAACLISGVHQQVAGLLGHPFTGGVGGDPSQVHASLRVCHTVDGRPCNPARSAGPARP